MAYCPVCKQQFGEGISACPTDQSELVNELPFQTIEGPASTWVEIESVGTEEEARLLRGFLEAEGIPCQYESLRFSMEPVNLGTMSEIRIYVSADNEETAMQILRERTSDHEQMEGDETVMTDEGPATIEDDSQMIAENEEP